MDWNALGIEWSEEEVAKQAGDNRSDRVTFNKKAQIPIPKDLEKIRKWLTDEQILSQLNGQGWRVPAQDVNRRMLERGETADAIRLAVYNRLRGTRNAGIRVEKVIRTLPNGVKWEGTDEASFRGLVAATYIDLGIPADTAKDLAAKYAW